MRSNTVAIQGSVASFHDLAAKHYFGAEIRLLHCHSFREVCTRIANNQVDYGLIAIENKIAGSILLNYQLIESFGLSIIGETYLPIELQLLGKPDAVLEDVREIVSHPMALGQCQVFLAELTGVRVSEFRDTASSAELVAQKNTSELAVIAGPVVASRFGLKPLVGNVCDDANNYTRFYILSKGGDVIGEADKASITVRLQHEAGALTALLRLIESAGLNLTKIQSIPIPNDDAHYSFHLDIAFTSKSQLEQVLTQAAFLTTSLTVLGIYKGALPPHLIVSPVLSPAV